MNTPIEEVAPSDIRETFAGFRPNTAETQAAMTRSLLRHGQISPLVCRRGPQGLDLIDGFKRLQACRSLQWNRVPVRVLDTPAKGAPSMALRGDTPPPGDMTVCCGKVEMIRLNRVSRSITPIEEALIVHSLHREDRWSLPEIARVVGRTLRWVTDRCSLAAGLHPQVREHLLRREINAGIAWELARLPGAAQAQCLSQVVQHRLSRPSVGTILRQASFLPWHSAALTGEPGHVLNAENPLPAPSRQVWYRRLAEMNRRQPALLAGAVEDLSPESEHDDRWLRQAMATLDQLRSFLDRQRHDQAEMPVS